MDLKITPNGQCKSPCKITIEAVPRKKMASDIVKYYFYIDDKRLESQTPKISTTIYFAKSLISIKQKKHIDDKAPLFKMFHIRAEGVISEDKYISSKKKRILVKASKENSSSIELISRSVLPMGKIQIATSGISSSSLSGTIDGQPISFEKDPIDVGSNIMYSFLPYTTLPIAKLIIGNFSFDITVVPILPVMDSLNFIQENNISSVELLDMFITSPKYSDAIGANGIHVFTGMRASIIALNDFVKNEALPEEIQLIADITNATFQSDADLFNFITYIENSPEKKVVFQNIIRKNNSFLNAIGSISSLLVNDVNAQALPGNLLKNKFLDIAKQVLEEALSIGTNTLFDGMINKCYISKGRPVPIDVVRSEWALNLLFQKSSAAIIAGLASANPFVIAAATAGSYAYTAGTVAASALVARIGSDCDGGEFISPKLVINSQPILPIVPGESINYNVKCDVGDERYYSSNSILTKVTSRLDYQVPSFEDAGILVSTDNLLNGCAGLGQDVIKNEHDIACTTNLLKDTQFYQNNIDQYETFNAAACGGANSYTAGMYLVDTPSLSCNFVNSEENVNIIGESINGNQLIFDLTKKWNCPKAVINYTKDNLQVSFDSTGNTDTTLTYSWSFGDGQTSTEKSPNHTYSQAGTYPVLLTVTDAYGSIASTKIDVSVISNNTASVTYCNISTSRGTMYFLVNESEEFYLSRTNDACECHTFQVPRGQYSSIYAYFELDGYQGYLESMEYEESIFGEDKIQYFRGSAAFSSIYVYKIPTTSIDFYKNSCAAIKYK